VPEPLPLATDGGSHLDRLRITVIDVKHAASTLEDLIHYPRNRSDDVIRRVAITGSSPSWNAQVAYLVFDLRTVARSLEAVLRGHVTGSHKARGGSDANTFLALDAVVDLAHAAGESPTRDALRELERWLYRARVALGQIEPMSQLPRAPGASEPRCPWCGNLTLRYQPHAGLVRCVNPECRDDDGRRPSGRVELGALSAEPILAWHDGSTGLDVA
jgi:hypothetical protein